MKRYILLTFALISFTTCMKAMDPALFKAARSNDCLKVQTLLEQGASPSAVDWCGATPLHNAYYDAQIDQFDSSIPQLLIAFGANPTAQDMRLNTPLHTAIRTYSVACIEQLIRANAQVDAPNARGETPLLLAVKKDAWLLVPTLIEAGATFDVTDFMGSSIVQIASNKSRLTRKALVTSISPQEIKSILLTIGIATKIRSRVGKDVKAHCCPINTRDIAREISFRDYIAT